MNESPHAIEVLLVEDDPGDVLLTVEAFEHNKVNNTLSVVNDGEQAMAFLRREGEYADAPRPDLILLDLNLPRKDGREVLGEIKADDDLRSIPVVVLTTSEADEDILRHRGEAAALTPRPRAGRGAGRGAGRTRRSGGCPRRGRM